MFIDAPPISDPAFIAFAADGCLIVSHGQYSTHADAVAWCSRAMKRDSEATMLAIARSTTIEWRDFGQVPALVPYEGWLLERGEWTRADILQIVRNFHDDTPKQLKPTTRDPQAQTATVVRTVSTRRDLLVVEVRRLTDLLERIFEKFAPSNPSPNSK